MGRTQALLPLLRGRAVLDAVPQHLLVGDLQPAFLFPAAHRALLNAERAAEGPG
ncbi:hypothetical protein D3C87_1826180 [compost metagenome]